MPNVLATNDAMTAMRHCAQCGTPLPADIAHAICPQCELRGALNPDEPTQTSGTNAAGADRPSTFIAGPLSSEQTGVMEQRRFGDFELLEEVARGGMGVVYKARQLSLDRIVAVKMILGGLATKEFVQRFRTEASAAASLRHPNIVAIHEVGVHEGEHFLAMDYVHGPNLSQLVARRAVPLKQAARYLKLIAEAVHYAHERNILHRDLKPANVLIDANDQPHITDFGLAKRLEADTDLTLSGQVLGSPNYISPEQAEGKRGTVGRRSDVYSLGAILYFLLTGRAPFQGQTLTEILHQVTNNDPIAPRLLMPRIPRDLETICLKCLEREPSQRYVTAQELSEDIERFLNDEPIHARPITRAESAWRWCQRKPAFAGSLAVAAVLLLVVAIGLPIAVVRIVRERQVAEQNLYLADMHLAAVALEDGNLGRARQLLEFHRLTRNRTDRRDFAWRLLSQQCRGDELETLPRRDSSVDSVLFSPDSKLLASHLRNSTLEVWDMTTRQVRFALSNVSRLGGFSSDGSRLAVGMIEGSIAVCEARTGRTVQSLRTGGEIVALLPDGKTVATTHEESAVKLWDLTTGREQLSIPGRGGFDFRGRAFGLRVCMTGDASKLAAFDSKGTGIAIWSILDKTVVASIPEPGDTARPLCFSADGKILVTGSFNGVVKLWDVRTGEPLIPALINQHQDPITAAAFSPMGTVLATASVGQTIKLWAASTGEELDALAGHENAVWNIAFSADGQTLVSSGADQTIKFWRVPAKRKVQSVSNVMEPLAWSADSRTVAGRSPSNTVTLLDVATLGVLRTLPDSGYALGFSSDAGTLFTAFTNGTVHSWDLAAGKVQIETAAGIDIGRGSIVFSANRKMAVIYASQVLRLWELASGKVMRLEEPRFLIESMAFSPAGDTVIAGGREGSIGLWDAVRRQHIGSIAVHSSPVSSLAFSPDGQLLASGIGGGEIKLWEWKSKKPLGQLDGHKKVVRSLAFSPDGKTLASSSADHTVRLWNTALRREVASLKPFGEFAAGWRGEIDFVEFSPDGNSLVARTRGGTFRILTAMTFGDTGKGRKPGTE